MHAKIQSQIKQIFQQQPITVLDCAIYLKDFESLYKDQLLRSEAISLLIAIIKAQHQSLFKQNETLSLQNLLQSEKQYKILSLRPCKIIQPSVTYMLLFMGQQDYILQSMQSQQLFSYRYLLIPCNTDIKEGGKGSHWFLIIYDTIQNCIYTMDSVYQCIHQNAKVMAKRLKRMKQLFKVNEKRNELIEKFQQKNSKKNGKMVDMLKMDDEIKITWLRNVIKQKNSYDCGIYVVGNIEIILSQLLKKQQSNKKKPQQKQPQQQQIILFNEYQINIKQIKAFPQQFNNLRQKYFYKSLQIIKSINNKIQQI